MNDTNKDDNNDIISNKEYREKLIDIFSKMDDNKKLRFWYKYISAIEKG